MSSPNDSKRYAAPIVGATVVLLIVYLLIPPVVLSLLGRAYGSLDRIPANTQKSINAFFAPTIWLFDRSQIYRDIILHEHRLLGNRR